VENALQKRLSQSSIFQASNWWARQDQSAFCGFDNRLTLQYSLPEEARFAACFIQKIKATRLMASEMDSLLNQIETQCRVEISALVGDLKK
jgi:hypothetical protein